jgi:hypothetical protein
LGAGLLQFLIFGGESLFGRIFVFSSVAIIIGFISYFDKLIQTFSIKNTKIKIVLILFTIFAITTSFYEERNYYNVYNIERNEYQNIVWVNNYTTKPKVIITEYLWKYLFIYDGYPYEEFDTDPEYLHYFITITDEHILPENHFGKKNINIFTSLQNQYTTEVYIFLTDYFESFSGLGGFKRIPINVFSDYYNLSYLNRICSTKTIYDTDEPIYWVI